VQKTLELSLKLSCQLPQPGLRSQQQPNRRIEEVIDARGFARRNGDGRNADRRLANRCVQALRGTNELRKSRWICALPVSEIPSDARWYALQCDISRSCTAVS
jgi:hypothetical protein